MPKKKVAKKAAPKSATAKKAPVKKKAPAKKKAPVKKKAAKKARKADEAEHVHEFQLDPVEEKAFRLAHSSAKVQRALEEAVTAALSKTVRKVFKDNRIDLTPIQATNMAMILFGD
jgi:hypothetical protein